MIDLNVYIDTIRRCLIDIDQKEETNILHLADHRNENGTTACRLVLSCVFTRDVLRYLRRRLEAASLRGRSEALDRLHAVSCAEEVFGIAKLLGVDLRVEQE